MASLELQYLYRRINTLEARVSVLSNLLAQHQAIIGQGLSLSTKISDGKGHYGCLGDVFACAKTISNDPSAAKNVLVIRPDALHVSATGGTGTNNLVLVDGEFVSGFAD